MDKVKNFLTFDIEEAFQCANLRRACPRENWSHHELRTGPIVTKILEILRSKNVTATFFVSAWLAEKEPNMIKAIDRMGHEVACHGYEHDPVCNKSPQYFKTDLKKALAILKNITGRKIIGFRAPNYSINSGDPEIWEILRGEGIEYDSSIFPGRKFFTGKIDIKHMKPYRVSSGLTEFPLTSIPVFTFMHIPVASGAFLRLYPYIFTKWIMAKLNRKRIPVVVNIHPWEMDIEQPVFALDHISLFKHYTNIGQTEAKLNNLLADFEFQDFRHSIYEDRCSIISI